MQFCNFYSKTNLNARIPSLLEIAEIVTLNYERNKKCY